MAKITLHDVEATLRTRLGVNPIKTLWRETRSDITNSTVCNGFESRYLDLSPAKVKEAMQGIPLLEKRSFKDRSYKVLLRWEHRSQQIKFRCTLYVREGNDCTFVFTADW